MSKLVLEVLADSNGLVKGLNQAQTSVDKFMKASAAAGQSLGGTLNRALGSFTGLAGGGAAAAGVLAGALVAVASGATAMAISAGKQGEELEQLAAITGINTDKLQEYEVMMNRSGQSGADLAQIMKHISSSLDQAKQGTGSAADRFRQLGINIRTVTSTDDLIQKIATSANRFADGTQKAAIMSDLLGKGWQGFMKSFQGGKQAFDETSEASKKLGQTLSTSQLAVLAQMDTSVDDLMITLKRFSQQLGVAVAPSVKMVVDLLKDMLAWGSHAFDAVSLGVDEFSVRLTHMALKAQEVFGTLFSTNAFSGAAWKQVLSNLAFIDKEADKQIAKLRAAAAMLHAPVKADTRAEPPPFIDFAKQAAQMQAFLDAQIRARNQAVQGTESINRAGLQNELAILDERRAAGYMTEHDLGLARQQAMMRADDITREGLQLELQLYKEFSAAKIKTFEATEKGIADRLKFEQEANGKTRQMIDAITVQQINADTTRIQSGLAVTSFWRNQLKDLVASNAFSISQIVTTWTSGIANSIVSGGNFVEAAWKSTQIAIIQGTINTGVQLAAQWALQKATELGILSAGEAAKLGLKTSTNAAIVAGDTAAATATVGVWGGAAAAISGFFATTLASFSAVVASMVGIVTAVGTFIMTVLAAIAEALSATVFGIPFAGAILLGIALIAAALAATGNLGFKEGGIGDFGQGTQATLHGKEAIIPLNKRGASFMQDMMGAGGTSQPITINVPVMLDGRQIAKATARHMPAAWRSAGAPA